MPDNCGKCLEHSGFQENIRELCDFKHKMTDSGIGTIDRIWATVETKISKGMLVVFTIAIIGLLGTLFGLVYHSNQKLFHEMSDIKADIATIKEKVK